MTRIQHLTNTLGTAWADEPTVRGTAKMAAGAVLIFVGLFGMSPLTSKSRKKGKKKRKRKNKGMMGGILGNMILLAAAGLFLVATITLWPETWDDQVETDGQVADYQSGTGSDGRPIYRPLYRFEADGVEYGFASPVRTNVQPEVGAEVRIAYSASDPEQARRIDGVDGIAHWLFFGVSMLLLLLGGGALSISLVLVGFGIWLFREGRRDLDKPADPEASMQDLRSTFSRIRSGEIDIENTAAGQSGTAGGSAGV
ncbi:DUF3592 domain-containing protein [Wenzhouxiangella sp. AB-CW3]|uniref:DUF3592 domain-containing protein n=1 Tax=Wenzhouxiangella sp. AB-CW3 TaxID=2771012 RepID=UPI00168B0F58|nr:DUF3592 domain-containing protein [Wenzhouxiangella sp. AB-CW3]QOC21093.1 DUF3592 domain-containing protein [Wenzhouxiangella sp. AB-CW3]